MDLLRLSVKTTSSVLAGLLWVGFVFAGFCGGVGVADFCLGAVVFLLSVGFAVGLVIVFVVGVLSAAGTMTVLESTTGNVLFSGIVASKRQGKVKRPFRVVMSSRVFWKPSNCMPNCCWTTVFIQGWYLLGYWLARSISTPQSRISSVVSAVRSLKPFDNV